MFMSGEQRQSEEAFSREAVASLLKIFEGKPARVALAVLKSTSQLIEEASQEVSVSHSACMESDNRFSRWIMQSKAIKDEA